MQKLKKHNYEGKNENEVLNKALNSLNASSEEVYYDITEKVSGTLFKSKKYIINVIIKEDLIEYIKSYLKNITSLMGLDVELEIIRKENYIKVNMLSDNSSILIGKNGRTMSAIQDLLRQSISKTGIKVNIILDANEYKEKQQRNIEKLAVKLARDVVKTNIEVKMDRMNSYERRLVHNKLTNFKGVTTISEGEEPNRCVVIKPVEK